MGFLELISKVYPDIYRIKKKIPWKFMFSKLISTLKNDRAFEINEQLLCLFVYHCYQDQEE